MATWVFTRQFCRHNSPRNDELWMAGALEAIALAGDLLEDRHFPAGSNNADELPDKPMVL